MQTLALWEKDPWLEPYKQAIWHRYEKTVLKKRELSGMEPLRNMANGHLFYGLQRDDEGWVLREWAPRATALYLLGECNLWRKDSAYAFYSIGQGNWELRLPHQALPHGMLYKWLIEWEGGSGERLPAYAFRCVQDPKTHIFSAQVWAPPQPYVWQHPRPPRPEHPLIYEVHIGMAGEEPRVHSFEAFTQTVLPRVIALGYNTIQLMAVQEHPYYGSFGYQVSNFFAVSSRFGTPESLKALIDAAHQAGIYVIMDLVHSHAVKNEIEGLSRFDGQTDLYFHSGARGEHPLWSSRCFDYSKDQVLHFLLSNCKYWLEEYQFDGFRFDGVTSMIYHDHGAGRDFLSYQDYFDGNQDEDALTYLSLANQLIRECHPQALSIAEEVSGLPGLGAPFAQGGMGFDYRMSMGVADLWIKWIKERPDEAWSVGELFHALTNKRADERTISYAECHDQAMVGDKTILFRLIDAKMYDSMDKKKQDLVVDRGLALHKIIRLLSLSTSGNGYLTFMGNEFGHPEWIDFPREGNNWSYAHARRLWSLAGDPKLHFKGLEAFDAAMIHLAGSCASFWEAPQLVAQDEGNQVLAFLRGNFLFVFNLHPGRSYTDYALTLPAGRYRLCLDSDAPAFEGFGRNDAGLLHETQPIGMRDCLCLYLPARTAQIFVVT